MFIYRSVIALSVRTHLVLQLGGTLGFTRQHFHVSVFEKQFMLSKLKLLHVTNHKVLIHTTCPDDTTCY